jgi:hypothetical protein
LPAYVCNLGSVRIQKPIDFFQLPHELHFKPRKPKPKGRAP